MAAHRLLQEHVADRKRRGMPLNWEVQHLFLPGMDHLTITSMCVVDDFPSPSCGIPHNYQLLLHLPSIDSFDDFTDAIVSPQLSLRPACDISYTFPRSTRSITRVRHRTDLVSHEMSAVLNVTNLGSKMSSTCMSIPIILLTRLTWQ